MMETGESNGPKREQVPDDVMAAVVAAVVLHRGLRESVIPLLGEGRLDEGAWGRSSRAGAGMGVVHRTRRDM
jgi:hypothetical protein